MNEINLGKEIKEMAVKEIETRPKAMPKVITDTKTTQQLIREIIEREGWDNQTTYHEFKKILRKT